MSVRFTKISRIFSKFKLLNLDSLLFILERNLQPILAREVQNNQLISKGDKLNLSPIEQINITNPRSPEFREDEGFLCYKLSFTGY